MENREQKLERLIGLALRQQPPLRAPAGFESRVLAELARRAALPWWRTSFANWPVAARVAFLVACAGLVKLAFSSTAWVLGAAAAPVSSVRSTAQVASSLGDAAHLLYSSIPSLWLYIAAGAGIGVYVMLFGLGATAYRTLYK